MLDLSRLSAQQREAVLASDGPLLVLAGPGSGKTTLLAARIAYLVTARQVPPASILAITFTTKAVRELHARLAGMLGSLADSLDVTTFHAFGLRIIRQWSGDLGFGLDPIAVYGDGEARALVREVSGELGLDQGRWPLGKLTHHLERHRLGGSALPDELQPLAAEYEARLQRRSAVDYPAMLALPLRLFGEHPRILRFHQDAYRHVLADEFQDVCVSQYQLLRLLAERHRNLVVVADPAQTIYGWRGADVRFIADFRRDFPEARVVSLDRNFRSTARIVALANALAAPLGYSRQLWTDNPPGQTAVLHVAPHERAEAEFVAAEIARLCETRHLDCPGEAAVLYRTNWQAEEMALALRERRLAYRIRGHADLFSRREVRDAVAYLRLAHNPADAVALSRIVNTPPRRLGRLEAALRVTPVPLAELPTVAGRYGQSALAGAGALVALVHDLHEQAATLPPAALLDLALEESGYRVWLTGLADGETRLAHLAALRGLAERNSRDLGAWLSELQLGEEAEPDADSAERVLLTTIHGAKGGEWRAVFVVGVEEGLLPHKRSLLLGDPLNGDTHESPTEHLEADDRSSVEEELRVAYVAVTRPRELLYLTCCRHRHRGERTEPRRPSRFLRGLPPDLLTRVA